MEVDKIDTRVNQSQPLPATATYKKYNATFSVNVSKREIEKSMFELCKSSKSVLLHILDPPSDESDLDIDELVPPKLYEIADNIKLDPNAEEIFENEMKSKHDTATIEKIEELTRGQSENPEWFSYRKGRITASVFSQVLHFRFTDKSDNYILQQIMGNSCNINTPSIQFGKDHEPIARAQYTEQYMQTHKHGKVVQCGLMVDNNYPYLGASPDGIVSCSCCGRGVLEIKCSEKYQNVPPADVCAIKDYHLYLNENNVPSLKLHKFKDKWVFAKQTGVILCSILKRALWLNESILIKNFSLVLLESVNLSLISTSKNICFFMISN